jgi:superfamily II DNA or RNA helicase
VTSPLEIVIEYGAFHHIKVTVYKDGKRMSPFSPGLSSSLRQLARQSGAYQTIDDELLRALETIETPVRLKILRQTPVTADWDPEAFYELRWGLNISGADVELRQEALDHLGLPCVVSPIGKQLVVDITRHKVGRVLASSDNEPTDIEAKFRKQRTVQTRVVVKAQSSDDLTKVGTRHYNQAPVSFETFEQIAAMRFSANDLPVTPVLETPVYFINIAPHPTDSSMCIIQPGFSLGADTFSLIECLTSVAEVLVDLPGAISTQNWRRILYELLDDAIRTDAVDADQIIALITPKSIPVLPPQLEAASDLIRRWIAAREDRSVSALAGSSWHFSQNDWLRQSLCITAPIAAYEEVSFDDTGFAAPADMIHKIAEKLENIVRGHGIQLRWDQQPLHFENWEIQANVSDEGDRYVLEPVIQFMGTTIRMESWDEILTLNGIKVSDTETVMLSSETIAALRALLRYQPKKSDEKGKRASSIVLTGRLRILDVLYLVKNGIRISLSDADQELLNSLTQFVQLEGEELPKNFVGSLREYQKIGFDWLVFLYRHRFGACLADDMGLGKTIQAIAFLAWVAEHAKGSCSLIVVPPSLVYNWRRELEKFAPDLIIREYTGAKRELVMEGTDVLISTYDIIRRDIDMLEGITFETIVFDEAQIIKNMMASRSAAVRRLSARFRACLTGTPLENHAGEFVSILELAVPGLTEGMPSKTEAIDLLVERARPFVLRRTKEKILKELPEKIESTVYLPLSEAQLAYYEKVVAEVREQVQQMFEKYRSGRAGLLAITALLRLRQLCITPTLIDPNYLESSPKIDYLVETLCELQEEGHSSLVFTQFRSFANLLAPLLVKKGIRFIQIDGQTRMNDRKKLIEDFQTSPESMVALMTLKTGGIGLNLVKASYVFHVDPWWNPAAENQASDRAHRIGQVQKVNVIRLIMQDSIEERVLKLKEQKQLLFDQVVNSGLSRGKSTALTKDDFSFLLS